MIRYSLKCAAGHVFDSWFRDSAAFDALAAERRIACALCGDPRVEKSLMAPSVKADAERPGAPAGAGGPPAVPPPALSPVPQPVPQPGAAPGPLAGPASPVERALAGLRRYLSENSEYVGRRFADEARRIHLGESEKSSVWGEATPEDARALADEGVPVAPLPFLARRDD